MPEREVKLSLMTYTDEAGEKGRYGFKGETVNVHEDYVEKFDELNVDQGPEYVPQRDPVALVNAGGTESKSTETDSPESLTVPELKAELDEAEVEYPGDARKDDLVKLVKKSRKA